MDHSASHCVWHCTRAGHYYNRAKVTTVGCLMWGVCTAGFSICSSLSQGYFFWAINGIGLSLVIPTGQSLIADYYHASNRGKAFGAMTLTGSLGGMLGSMYATNLGTLTSLCGKLWYDNLKINCEVEDRCTHFSGNRACQNNTVGTRTKVLAGVAVANSSVTVHLSLLDTSLHAATLRGIACDDCALLLMQCNGNVCNNISSSGSQL